MNSSGFLGIHLFLSIHLQGRDGKPSIDQAPEVTGPSAEEPSVPADFPLVPQVAPVPADATSVPQAAPVPAPGEESSGVAGVISGVADTVGREAPCLSTRKAGQYLQVKFAWPAKEQESRKSK